MSSGVLGVGERLACFMPKFNFKPRAGRDKRGARLAISCSCAFRFDPDEAPSAQSGHPSVQYFDREGQSVSSSTRNIGHY